MVVLKCFTGFKHINSNYVNKWRKCNIMSCTSATSAPFIAATFMFSPLVHIQSVLCVTSVMEKRCHETCSDPSGLKLLEL